MRRLNGLSWTLVILCSGLNQGRIYIKENTFMNYRSERDAFEAGKISSGFNRYLTNSVEHGYFEDGSSLSPRCVFLSS